MFRLTSPEIYEDIAEPDSESVLKCLASIRFVEDPIAILENTNSGSLVQAIHQCFRTDGIDEPDCFHVEWIDISNSAHSRVENQSLDDTVDIFLAFLEQDEDLLNDVEWKDVTKELSKQQELDAAADREALFWQAILIPIGLIGLVGLIWFLIWAVDSDL